MNIKTYTLQRKHRAFERYPGYWAETLAREIPAKDLYETMREFNIAGVGQLGELSLGGEIFIKTKDGTEYRAVCDDCHGTGECSVMEPLSAQDPQHLAPTGTEVCDCRK